MEKLAIGIGIENVQAFREVCVSLDHLMHGVVDFGLAVAVKTETLAVSVNYLALSMAEGT